MIEQVTLRDLGVIAEATLPFSRGFTAITGETGAGKTMVVTGLGLLLGRRADAGVIRGGVGQAVVEGVWTVPDDGPVADRVRDAGGDLEPAGQGAAELYLGRTVSAEGRSRATVGGRTAPAAVLAELADLLVVVHGQTDQLRLRSAAAQRDALDRYGGDEIVGCLQRYRTAYDAWQALAAERDELVRTRDERRAEADGLRAALEQITAVDPRPDEDVRLAAQAERLGHLEELRDAAASARLALSSDEDTPDVTGLLGAARHNVEHAAAADAALAPFAADLADLAYRAADVATGLSGYLADLDDGAADDLEAVQQRRAELNGLIRVHGTLDAALELAETGPLRLLELDDDPERIERLDAAVAAAAADLDAAAAALTAVRVEAAGRLAGAVTAELQALAMPDALLQVAVEPAEQTRSGRDAVTILLAPHPGAPLRPVARGASGGELSRVMLAIEVVLAAVDEVPTFVFDEVDAGIGGAAAIEVGRRLARLAEHAQVIAVTHLAQVAAFAGNHLSVVKSGDGTVTRSSVRLLDGADREREIARLLSGMSDSDAALRHARELLASTGSDHR